MITDEELRANQFVSQSVYDALFYAADGQLFWVTSVGEYRNRLGVVFDANAVKGLVMAGFLAPSIVACSISTAAGWAGAERLDLTDAGCALYLAQQPGPRREALEELARWLVSLDDGRRLVEIDQIVERARQALGEKEN